MKSQVLGSLVLNKPDKVAIFTTSPKISKLISLPFGFRVSCAALLKNLYQLTVSLITLMSVSSLFIFFFYLPLENKNTQLLNNARDLTNDKYLLLEDLERTSSYNKLFNNAEKFSLKDTKNVIYIEQNVLKNTPAKDLPKVLSNYPEVLFTGF